MITFMRKHYILTALFLISLVIYIYLYFTDFLYDPDRRDARYYPINLTEKWSKTFEYKPLPLVRFDKCFMVSFRTGQLHQNIVDQFGEEYYRDYRLKYEYGRVVELSDEEFYAQAKAKPHFILKIYQDDVLVKTTNIYFPSYFSFSSAKIGDRTVSLTYMTGKFQSKGGACYSFSEKSHYRFEIINGPYPTFCVNTHFNLKVIV